ncbi:APC family permease [Actinotalea sp. Marseille-Q4924]|uniref:APC family permease n=1 Tax=Actinotalea sp. Marseille-Q4924 TaxID=2866571 RepID=UPI001CE48187|nr:APC family permease [Actinotalea sp. Marseille-Q4924]
MSTPLPHGDEPGGLPTSPGLVRRLGLLDATTVGLGAMLGAGVFVAFGPAAAAAGATLPLALVLAGLVAWANADSSARLAAVLPTSGGAYAYGRARLGTPWGVLAGAAFLLGKTLSTGAITWTVGTYLWPDAARSVAVAAVLLLTGLAAAGLQRGVVATRAVVVVVLVTLLATVVGAAAALLRGSVPAADLPAAADVAAALTTAPGVPGLLQGAGVLFFAFAGYARVATLGEEVRDPRRTLPRAIAAALATVLVVYAAVGATLMAVLGPERLAASQRPVADAVEQLAGPGWAGGVVVVAALAALASALGVLLGLSRTTLAMARDGVLPRAWARLTGGAADPRPVRAQLVVGGAVVVGLLVLDLPRAIAASSVAVLVYYAVAHAAALTLPGRARRVVPVLGLAGCVVVAAALAVGLAGG